MFSEVSTGRNLRGKKIETPANLAILLLHSSTEKPRSILCPVSFKRAHKFKAYPCQLPRKVTAICVISLVELALQSDHKYVPSCTHKHLEVLSLTVFWKAICVSNSTPESLVFMKRRHNKLYNKVSRGGMVEVWILHTMFLK